MSKKVYVLNNLNQKYCTFEAKFYKKFLDTEE